MTWRNRPTWCRLLSTVNPEGAIARLAVGSIIQQVEIPAAVPRLVIQAPYSPPSCASPHRRWRAPNESVVQTSEVNYKAVIYYRRLVVLDLTVLGTGVTLRLLAILRDPEMAASPCRCRWRSLQCRAVAA